MFEHMWKSREDLLKAEFENYSLGDEETLIFIKELISGFTTLREKYQTIEEVNMITKMLLIIRYRSSEIHRVITQQYILVFL